MKEIKTAFINFLALFMSFGTLICCVLPIVFVSLGLGVALTGLFSQFPILITLSQHKIWIFLTSAALLTGVAWLLWGSPRSCPADPKLAALCERMYPWNKRIFWVALTVWIIGTSVTYIILPLWMLLEG